MRGLQKSKRVSWAPDLNLCQVRLFLSEDSPAQVGLGAEDNLQAKASWLLHSTTGVGSDDHLPPGFEGAYPSNQLKKELPQIPLIKWKCPHRIVVNPSWQVVAGEESKETLVQSEREMRVLEAVYPRPSAIPPSPAVSLDAEDYHHNGSHPLIIPVTPIEDDDGTDPSCNSVVPSNSMGFQPPVVSQGLLPCGTMPQSQYGLHSAPKAPNNEKLSFGANAEHDNGAAASADIGAAASAAFTAIMRSSEQGSMIDRELLIKILSNPKLVEELVANHGNLTNSQATLKPNSPPMTFLVPQSVRPPSHISKTEPPAPSPASPATGVFSTNAVVPRPPLPEIVPTAKPPPVKDINYFKSLIQQHGGERQETQDRIVAHFSNHHNQQMLGTSTEPLQSLEPRELKRKISKPCVFFNSSRGCRNGANCSYQHDGSYQRRPGGMPQAQAPKRMRIEREITGRT